VSRPGRGLLGAAVALAVLGAALLGVGLALQFSGGSDDGGGPRSASGLRAAIGRAHPADDDFPGLTEARVAVGGQCRRVVVADTEPERVQGLRNRRDLGPYRGMLFVFGADSTAAFTMADTVVPLDIGFYDTGGRPVDHRHLVPCAQAQPRCPLYRSRGPYRYALETLRGALGSGGLSSCPG
jgi:uncharacterized membrane protein (UPF0127 family)